ncbi:hypothetical protein BD324DRAFT_629669 [Kockovaella imperatae]|uniref:Uncharacterized protein n=1 Tax=Kockovaella imperatae TaxID=4999 RepID=A0A1Y1UD34_9TREE|nr:hypothetical protein BD324DRAFT_629669 [Kockovaella imperatae]ORX35961.1 hypothetical protein BD324DRAFT_629669 [Kockovaella imperatae]
MSNTIAQWAAHASQSFSSAQGPAVVASIPLNDRHSAYHTLVQALSSVSDTAISTTSVLSYVSVRNETKDIFASFLVAILKYLQVFSNSSPDAERAIEAFRRLNAVQIEANRLYGMTGSDGGFIHAFMNPFMVMLCRHLIRTAKTAAAVSPHPPRSNLSSRSIRDTTRQTIEKTFQISSSVVSEGDWAASTSHQYLVGDIVWPLANMLWRIYAERKLHTQASGLAKTLGSLTPPENKRVSSRAMSLHQTDLCESYYWRGKLGVVLLDMRNAKFWLDKAWQMCPSDCHQQQRAILIRLLPVNLLLGYSPTMTLLQRYKLGDFMPLLRAFQSGNVVAFRRELLNCRDWYRHRSIWLILYERGEILVWRNLFRRALRLYYNLNPESPKNRCPTWVFLAASQRAFEGSNEVEVGNLAIEDIICVMSSLIDQVSRMSCMAAYFADIPAHRVSSWDIYLIPMLN